MALAENSLFLRGVELVVGPKVTGVASNVEPPDGRLFKNRIQFSIEKTSTPNPNKSKISLYNISQESRNFLEQSDLVLFLKAGFNNELSNIFIGDILRREAGRNGPDITYTLECGDAEKILTRAHIDIGLGPGATNVQLFELAAQKLGLTLGVKKGIVEVVFKNGFSFSGLAADLLTEQTKNIGLEWSVQDGELRIMPLNEDDGEEAVVISKETGLIGFPTKTPDGVKFTSLLNPKLRPGKAVKLETRQFQGQTGPNANILAATSLIDSGAIVKVRTATFSGDTREGSFTTDVEAVLPATGAVV